MSKLFRFRFMILCMSLMLGVVFGNSCAKQDQAFANLGADIENRLKIIQNPNDLRILLSSNTADYINFNKTAYDGLVKLGQPALEYMQNQLSKTSADGMRENIMARACCDILGDKNPVKEWRTAKEWYEKYMSHSKSK